MLGLNTVMSPVLPATFVVCLGCFIYATWLAKWVLGKDEGSGDMHHVRRDLEASIQFSISLPFLKKQQNGNEVFLPIPSLSLSLSVYAYVYSLQISEAIRDGAEGFFSTQYGTITKLSLVLSVVIWVIYSVREPPSEHVEAGIKPFMIATFTALSFLLGAMCSGIAGNSFLLLLLLLL